MAEDDQDRAREAEAEREAEIEEEMKRVGEDPDQLQDGESDLGKQSAPSGEVREEATPDEQAGDETETVQEDAQELPDEQQREQWEETGGDAELAREATADEDEDESDDE